MQETTESRIVEGWAMPAAPICPTCGKPAEPGIFNCGSGEVGLQWWCMEECDDAPDEWDPIEWPFVTEIAEPGELETLGFKWI